MGEEVRGRGQDRRGEGVSTPADTVALAWHWHNGKLRDGRPVIVGETITHDGLLVLCESGLHASERAADALRYAPGSWISRVECSGETLRQDDKFVCRRRKVLWTYDAERVLWEWLCRCAERALPIFEAERPADKRPRAAIDLRRAWIGGRSVTDEEWAAAWDAARVAARAAAPNKEAMRIINGLPALRLLNTTPSRLGLFAVRAANAIKRVQVEGDSPRPVPAQSISPCHGSHKRRRPCAGEGRHATITPL